MPIRQEIHSEIDSIFQYFDKLMIRHFGETGFRKITEFLVDLTDDAGNRMNADCGVETTYFIYPSLLLAKGVKMERSYLQEYGIPKSNGDAAATVAQRRFIVEKLRKSGYEIKIPIWFNEDLSPK